MIDVARVLSGLPSGLRNELLAAYEAIVRNYLEHRWEPSELNGGKFSEVTYTILLGVLSGNMPQKATKPQNFLAACRALEQTPPSSTRIGDHSLRLLIPRILPAMYDIRNNRNVGHVGGDVDPNLMDASAVYGMASWILAELVRIFHGVPTAEAQAIVEALVQRKNPIIWEVEGVRRVLNTSLKVSDQTLALLYGSPSWSDVRTLIQWVEYSNPSKFRSAILGTLHKARLIEFDHRQDRACLTPLGIADVEARVLKTAA